ncbi:unnamed protein product, partial [Notodromas monacha]
TKELSVVAKTSVGASLFASNIGSEHFIGLAGSGAASGIGIACFELHAMFTMIVLGWVFVPVYRASGVFTMPEYLRKRFGGQRIRVYISCLALMLYVFVKISADLYAGSIFLDQAFGLKHWYISVLILLLIAGVFTMAGGLAAVIWTDLVQAIIMILGAFIVMVKSFIAVGGYSQLVERFFHAQADNAAWDPLKNMTCGQPPSYAMHLLRDSTPGKSDIPWSGIVFGLPISAIWYWCSDQVIVQRVLASKNMIHAKGGCLIAAYLKFLPLFLLVFPGMAARVLFPNQVACADPVTCEEFCGNRKGCWNIAYPYLVIVQRVLASKNMIHAKGGCLIAAYLKFLPLFLLVFPGMAARVLFPNQVACADPVTCEEFCGNRKGCWNIAYPYLVINLLPAGLRGLMLACMMAAIMSSLTSIFNSSSTVFTIDIWRRFRRTCSEAEQLIVGRLFVLGLVSLSILWIPVIMSSKGSQLFHYMQSVTSFLAPPICAIYVLGIFVPRVNEKGAFTGLMVGLAAGIFRFVLEFMYTVPPCGSDPRPDFVKIFVGKVHFLHFGLALLFFNKKGIKRLFVLGLVSLSILWIPVIMSSKGSQLFHYMQSVTSFLAPPICAIYVLGIFVPRVNEKGAFTGLMVGLAAGIFRFVLEFMYTVPPCGSDYSG